MAKLDILRELRRRNVIRAAILYATSVWALSQGIATLAPILHAPDAVTRWFLVAAAIGFPFWIGFVWVYELTPDGFKRESDVEAEQSITQATGRKLDFLIIAVLTLAVVLLLTDRLVDHPAAVPAPRTAATSPAPPAAAPAIPNKSIAVLPLVNESGDANALYFSDGLSEGFITALSQFPGLKVIGRASSFLFRNSKLSSAVIGEKLGVAHLLEGSVQHAGGEVRIDAELINAKDGSTLWSKRYDRPYKGLFKLQDDITQAVATALKAKLLGTSTPTQTDRPPSGNLEAYNAYLQGEFYSRRVTEMSLRKAIDAYKTAVRIDPRYAQAWARLAIAWTGYGEGYNGGADQKKVYAKARKAADQALVLAPGLAAAHTARGNVLMADDFDWAGAEAEMRRALQLAPNNPTVKFQLASLLAALGREEEAAKLLRQAIAADPLDAHSYFVLGQVLFAVGRLDAAENALRKAIELQPAAADRHVYLSYIAIERGDAKAALEAATAEPPGIWHDIGVALALQAGTDRAVADSALKSLIGKYSADAPYQIAEAYAIRKDPDAMFQWLDRALMLKDPGLTNLLSDPFILRYKHDPRFAALCRKLKLPVPTTKG